MLSLLWMLACGGGEAPPNGPSPAPFPDDGPVGIQAQAGEQHPPIPAENPGWRNVTPDFKPVPMAYGEERWDDVTMRVIGHFAQATRDLARLDVQEGKPLEAIARYRRLATQLAALKLDEAGQSRAIRRLHVQAAHHHAAVLSKQTGLDLEEPEHLGPNSQRRWQQAAGHSPEPNSDRPWKGLEIGAFQDFRDRHALRLRMNEHWLDSVDPGRFTDPWGYWRPEVADAIADAIGGGDEANVKAAYPQALSAEDLGRLPTGDSYLDTAGGAGPMSIGSLAVLGLDDAEHHRRLEAWAVELNALLQDDPDAFVHKLEGFKAILEAYSHGSRFYNVKQLINAGTRHLARAGHYKQALQVFSWHRPLHAQDWLCPNREGIQLGIEGRLHALLGEPAAARERLKESVREALIWFGWIAEGKRRPDSRKHQNKLPPE
jgi:hypothetical protein